jgi:ATP-dependent RNA/DNA helicase IGHMBP2
MNVAVTRARRNVTVICDSNTISSHPFLKNFINYCQSIDNDNDDNDDDDNDNDDDNKKEIESFTCRTGHEYEYLLQNAPLISKPQLKVKSVVISNNNNNNNKNDKKNDSKNKGKRENNNNNNKIVNNNNNNNKSEKEEEEDKKRNEERNEGIKLKLNNILIDFINNNNEISYSFPSSLSSFERMIVNIIILLFLLLFLLFLLLLLLLFLLLFI